VTSADSNLPDEQFANWTIQMRKGVLDLCILKALASREWYGYELVKALVALPGVGVSEGSIYPLLARLRKQGLVTTRLEESSGGPARKYYRLTSAGQALADEMASYFRHMTQGVEAIGTPQLFTDSSPEILENPKPGISH
jgi:PadR family transcriptional regulator PadR